MKTLKLLIVAAMALSLAAVSLAQGKTAPVGRATPVQTKVMVKDYQACLHCDMCAKSGKCPKCKMAASSVRGKEVFGCEKCKTDANKAGMCPKCKKPMTKMVMTYYCDKCKTSSSQSGNCNMCGKFRSKHMLKM